MDIVKGIWEALTNIGLYTYDFVPESDAFRELDITKYIDDSIQFISFVIELEQIFGVEIDDSMLVPENFETIPDIIRIVESLKNIEEHIP